MAQRQSNAVTLHALQSVGHGRWINGVVYTELHAVPGISLAALNRVLVAMR